MHMFAVWDKKLESYMQPWFAQSKGAAIRAFGDSVKEQGSPANKHPEDYTLHYVGEFNEEDGSISQDLEVRQIATAQQFAE